MKSNFLLLASMFCLAVSARKAPGGKHRKGKRPMTIKIKKDGFQLKSHETFEDRKGHTDLKLDFTTKGFPRWRIDYHGHIDNIKADTKFRMGMVGLVEYNDTISVADSTSRIQFSQKKGKHRKYEWLDLEAPENAKEDPTGEYSIVMSSRDNVDDPFKVKVSTTLSSEVKEVIDDNYNPSADPYAEPTEPVYTRDNGCKFGLEIANFPYKYENSSLALVTIVETKSKMKQRKGKKEVEDFEEDTDKKKDKKKKDKKKKDKKKKDKKKKGNDRMRVLVEGDEEEDAAPVDNIIVGDGGESSINWATTFTDENDVVYNVLGGLVSISLPEYDENDVDDDDDRHSEESTRFVVYKFESNGSQPGLIIWDPELAVNEDDIFAPAGGETDDETSDETDNTVDDDGNASSGIESTVRITVLTIACCIAIFAF